MATDPAPRLPTISVASIGHYRHGKSSVTAAISHALATRPGATATKIQVLDLDKHGGPGKWFSDSATRTVAPGDALYSTEHRNFIHTDSPGHRPWLKNASRAQGVADAVLLVVSAPESVQPQTQEHLLLARALGLRQLVVFINKCDEAPDLEWVDLVERDVRELLDRTGFDGNTTRILRGAARPALAGDPAWLAGIGDLVDALETELTVPLHDPSGPPLLYIHRAHDPAQFPRDVVVEGRLRRGTLTKTDRLLLLGHGAAVQVRAVDLEVNHQKVDHAEAGQRVGIQLHSLDVALRARGVFNGQAVVPRDAVATQEFRARLELLATDIGGRTTGVGRGHLVQLLFGTLVVSGTVEPPEGVIAPGETADVDIKLRQPMYIEPGMLFAVRDGNQGAGWRRGDLPRWAGSAGRGEVLTSARRAPSAS
jgi:elongation factor Tu